MFYGQNIYVNRPRGCYCDFEYVDAQILEGIREMEVPGRNPAIVSGGSFRQNHAPHISVLSTS